MASMLAPEARQPPPKNFQRENMQTLQKREQDA